MSAENPLSKKAMLIVGSTAAVIAVAASVTAFASLSVPDKYGSAGGDDAPIVAEVGDAEKPDHPKNSENTSSVEGSKNVAGNISGKDKGESSFLNSRFGENGMFTGRSPIAHVQDYSPAHLVGASISAHHSKPGRSDAETDNDAVPGKIEEGSNAETSPVRKRAPYALGQAIITFQEDTSVEQIRADIAAAGRNDIEVQPLSEYSTDWTLVTFPKNVDMDEMLDFLNSLPSVDYAQPNFLYYIPEDPAFFGDEPVDVPEQPTTVPDEPVSAPEESGDVSEQPASDERPIYVAGEALISFSEGTDLDQIRSEIAAAGRSDIVVMPMSQYSTDWTVVTFDEGEDMQEMLTFLEALPSVDHAQPNFLYYIDPCVEDEPENMPDEQRSTDGDDNGNNVDTTHLESATGNNGDTTSTTPDEDSKEVSELVLPEEESAEGGEEADIPDGDVVEEGEDEGEEHEVAQHAPYVLGEALIAFPAGIDVDDIRQEIADAGRNGIVVEPLSQYSKDWTVVTFSQDADMDEMLAFLGSLPSVDYAQPNFIYYLQ